MKLAPGGVLGLVEEPEAKRQDGRTDEHLKQGVASDNVPHRPHSGNDGGASGGQHAGDSDSLSRYLLPPSYQNPILMGLRPGCGGRSCTGTYTPYKSVQGTIPSPRDIGR